MTIEEYVENFYDPALDIKPFARANKVTLSNNTLTIEVGYQLQQQFDRWQSLLKEALSESPDFTVDNINIVGEISARSVQTGLKPLPQVKNIIAIASGKGGVGKSTVAVNLACVLQQQGANVGLLDADIYGPSQARMLGGAKRPESYDGKTMQPIMRHHLQTLSMADLVEEDTAMIWRGPMVTQTLMQLLNECQWQDLDYLFIDLPPGTGDTQLTLSQQIPVSGAVIVSTPQDISLIDARKAKTMFDKVSINVLGMIENMSVYICPNCGHHDYIFGQDGAKALAKEYDMPLLGQLPLNSRIREQSDQGQPIVLTEPEHEIAAIYRQIAVRLAVELAAKNKSFTQAFPKIVVER